MEIRKIKREELKEALDLVWKVFLKFESPDYSDEGIDEFRKSIGRKLYDKVCELNADNYFTINASSYAKEIYEHMGFQY